MRTVDAMLGDGTVTKVSSFDPQQVRAFYERLKNSLTDWTFSGIIESSTEDLRRLFCQFTKELGKYFIRGYFGIQFHVLPYYSMDKQVLEIQKELFKIAGDSASVYKSMTGAADRAVADELEKRGYAGLEFQELFTKMFDDEKLAQDLDKKASDVEGQFGFYEMDARRKTLLAKLNDLVVELYQTSSVSIDYNRLMQGEEGITNYFEIEIIKNKKTKAREAYVDTRLMKKDAADFIVAELGTIEKAMKKARLSRTPGSES